MKPLSSHSRRKPGGTRAGPLLAGLVVGLALIAGGTRPAGAQEATYPGGVQILFTPNLWLAGVNATIKTPLPRVPEVNADVGPFQVLGHLSGVPFLASGGFDLGFNVHMKGPMLNATFKF